MMIRSLDRSLAGRVVLLMLALLACIPGSGRLLAVPGEGRESGPHPALAAGRPSAAPEGDIAPETHLDEEIALERAREQDLLSSDGRTE